jgi:hypothetical protein
MEMATTSWPLFFSFSQLFRALAKSEVTLDRHK